MEVSRKRITTYGKAGKRRIPDYGFASRPLNAPTPQVESREGSQPAATTVPIIPTKLSPVRRKPTSRAPPSTSLQARDIFALPSSEDEAPRSTQKAAAHRTTNTKASKHFKRNSTVGTMSPVVPDVVDTFDVPPSDNEAPKHNKKVAASRPSNTKTTRPIQQRQVVEVQLPAASEKSDVFDMPGSDDEIANLSRRIRAPLLASTQKPKLVQHRKAVNIAPSPASTKKADVFDVPSSEDEAPPVPKSTQKTGHISAIKVYSKNSNTTRPASTVLEETKNRKRAKLSPLTKPGPITTAVKPSKSRTTSHTTKHRPQTSLSDARLMKIAARPKSQVSLQNFAVPETPKKQTAVQNEYGTPSPPFSDADMMDIDLPGDCLFPKDVKRKGLLKPTEESNEGIITKNSLNGLRGKVKASTVEVPAFERSLSQPAGVSKGSQSLTQRARRRRLIDSLVEQAMSQDDEDEDEESDKEKDVISLVVDSKNSPDTVMSNAPSSRLPEALPPITLSDSQSSQTMGPKITYSRQRSMLAEADFIAELTLDMPVPQVQSSQGRRGHRGTVPKISTLGSFHEKADDSDTSVVAVQSVHELRQAGAVNRFLDEAQDFLDRIGKPGTQLSMRRSGLLDLSSKIQDKNFARQFRANGIEQRLFVHLGQETDILSGFLMVSLLISVLVDNNMPHIVGHLRRQGITRLIIRLLDCQSSIIVVGKERKSNMSKIAQSLLAEHHEKFLQMPIWEDLYPQSISPRTAALKCLEVMVRQTREAGNSGDIFSKELTTNLFAILKSASNELSWKLPKEKQAIDFYLALSALESHSITARTVLDESIWISDYLPIIASTLEVALSRPLEDSGVLQLLILRLTLNVTNNNPKASDVFARGGLMSAMGQVIVTRFGQISHFLTEEEFSVALDHLILVLGVMINFAEWSSSARECFQNIEGETTDPLDAMTQTYLENQERASTAESLEEEGQKYVVFGYLSVLLGYLSLLPNISKRIQSKQPGKNLKPLLASIKEFIGYHKTVDRLTADEDGHNRQSGLTGRLESLVEKLTPASSSRKP